MAASSLVTVTDPLMPGWMMQSYLKVPVFVKVVDHLPPGATILLSKDLSAAVAVCGSFPVFVNVPVEPTGTVTFAGANRLSRISTDALIARLPFACDAAGAGAAVAAAVLVLAEATGAVVRVVLAAPAEPVVAATTTVPSMPGWNEHLYPYVPALA